MCKTEVNEYISETNIARGFLGTPKISAELVNAIGHDRASFHSTIIPKNKSIKAKNITNKGSSNHWLTETENIFAETKITISEAIPIKRSTLNTYLITIFPR
jgi:hypothetical protein